MILTMAVPPSPLAVVDISLLAGSMCKPWKNTFVSLALLSNDDDDDDDDDDEEEEEEWCVLAARLFFKLIVITSPGSTNKVGPGIAHNSL